MDAEVGCYTFRGVPQADVLPLNAQDGAWAAASQDVRNCRQEQLVQIGQRHMRLSTRHARKGTFLFEETAYHDPAKDLQLLQSWSVEALAEFDTDKTARYFGNLLQTVPEKATEHAAVARLEDGCTHSVSRRTDCKNTVRYVLDFPLPHLIDCRPFRCKRCNKTFSLEGRRHAASVSWCFEKPCHETEGCLDDAPVFSAHCAKICRDHECRGHEAIHCWSLRCKCFGASTSHPSPANAASRRFQPVRMMQV